MNRHAPEQDINEDDLQIHPPKRAAAGVKAVTVALERGYAQAGVTRTVRSMLRVNQHDGFDCPGCAWPESITGRRSPAEFCENGAKAIAEESTTRTVGAGFWAEHPIAELEGKTEYWLGSQGRIAEPVVIRPGDTHYSPISWTDAFALIGEHINATTPDKCVFYTSGRTANETAFMYQLFARSLGTNNLPDCSNMCHESSGSALNPTIGIGKGTVSLDDIHHSELVLVVGQNPGTNHPRMLSALRDCKNNGGKVVAVNPLPEAGLLNFKDPQSLNGVIGGGTTIADEFLQIKVGGDLALFQALGHLLLEEEKRNPGTVVDHSFIESQTEGFDAYREARSVLDWAETERATGLSCAEITKVAGMMAASKATVICWALGLTQQPHSVDTLREIINLLLLQGNFGKRGAGACPVRGHSNVQGDRTMGIWEKPKESFLAALDQEFGFHMPRDHGYDSVETQHALEKGDVDVFVSMGGNFAAAGSDTAALEEGLKRAGLTVHISTKPNRAHIVHGRTSLILPTLGRTDTDDKHPKGKQFLSVEDSMSVIHKTQGRLEPVSEHLLSEPVIVARMAQATFGDDHSVDWRAMAEDYDVIRDHISRVIPGFEDFNARVRTKNGFVLPNPPRDSRTFATDIGKGRFSVRPLEYLEAPEGHLILQTVRSHDQYNTTFYGLDDRYRGVSDGRRVVLVHPDDLTELGFNDRDLVDVISTFAGTERRADKFRLIGYPTARGCAAAYFPEANALVHRELVARESNTPGYKAMTVRFVNHEENGS
ncbi:FdhF/YdeP family oxidoreductase [Paenarthrobacter nicotinovorans]|uniref:FdhF/YdeP family oxidoreductase n=1 Tax=Paenarthrobacter nicotinovorans TaxID=29320 RepID=UPI0016648D3E|nr:FdhF/YdeP family oxidoreductase [Paenarthrobacter nicotinovorans]MBP2393655.1 formate dehydrogenase major subunit [Paenarthrobacter nicotinovorans]UKF00098.1 FdhF/YdeP family oxidoreductase [Paenarthrobacter nicotinovorans]UKF04880.1 FdhF/YdeP family oxidoreductase [Paenarthrobacter nicotinovorans]GGV33755.1 formate dehydrogenase subunit alpha [Paenarthrobacter nicotinovorans]